MTSAETSRPSRPTRWTRRSRRQQRPRRTALQRVLFWSGTLMILTGLGLLGWVGWQMYGTTWVSHREQGEIATDIQRQWDRPSRQLEPRFVPKGKASAIVRIPAFGKSYAVPVLEGTSEDTLTKGYGHFDKTADPGQVGNYALAAHRITHGEPLRRMPELRPGDEVVIETVRATYTYRLDTNPNDLVVPFTGVWVLDRLPSNPDPDGAQPRQRKGQRLITLTTCSELFHTDNRMIAFGHLVATKAKPPRPRG